MPSLKELLQTAYKLTFTQTLPTTPTTQSATVDGNWHTVVSPVDGYALLTTTAGNPGNFEATYDNIGFDSKVANSQSGVAIFVPIKKGGNFNYRITNAQGNPTVQIRFFPFVGAS